MSNKKPNSPLTPEEEPHSIVFLDLEETVIDNWDDGLLLPGRIEKIERFMNGKVSSYGKDANGEEIMGGLPPLMNMRLGLMSWAVWNDKDKATFNERFREPLERLLNRKFDDELVWSMHDWHQQVFRFSNKLLMKDDMFDMFGKQEVLFTLARRHSEFKGKTVFLIDDTVEHHMTIKVPTQNCTVQFMNIYKM